jgi:hypothetical protein
MVAKIIDGHAVARQVRQECRELTDSLKDRGVGPLTVTKLVHNTVQSDPRAVR